MNPLLPMIACQTQYADGLDRIIHMGEIWPTLPEGVRQGSMILLAATMIVLMLIVIGTAIGYFAADRAREAVARENELRARAARRARARARIAAADARAREPHRAR